MRAALGNFQDIGDRPEQQDAFAFSDWKDRNLLRHGGVAGVLVDGMGGMRHGALAAQTAVRAFLDSYQQKPPTESIPVALKRALLTANAAVVEFARQSHAEGEMGATLVAAVLHEGRLFWISAGDSRAYLVRKGRLYQLTTDHNYGTELDEAVTEERIEPIEAVVTENERDEITRFIGMDESFQPDGNVEPLPLDTGDATLLCSDGLYRTLKDEEIASLIGQDWQGSCERLVHATVRKKVAKQDNVTALLIAPARTRIPNWPRILRIAYFVLIVINLVLLAVFVTKLAHGLRAENPKSYGAPTAVVFMPESLSRTFQKDGNGRDVKP